MSLTGSDSVPEAENSSMGQRDGAPAETDSDSGDSLFITQKPVPEAVRSGRRRRSSFRSDPPSSIYADECEGLTSSDRRKRRDKLPMYSFSFLRHRRTVHVRIGELKRKQNTSLHNAAMGGFFKCVRELWQSNQREEDLESSLPTVDMPGESISPISEEEDDKPEDEDIRVVEKKRFVVSLKAKCSRPWCTSNQGDSQENQQRGRRSENAGHETSRGGRRKTLDKGPPVTHKSRAILSTDTDSDEDEETSGKALVDVMSVTGTPKTHKENEDDSSASSPTEASAADEDVLLTDEAERQNLLQTDTNNDSECSESRVKKKKRKDRRDNEVVEEETGQSQEELEGQHDVGITEVEENPSVSQTIDEPEIHEINSVKSPSHDDDLITLEERDIPDSKKKKKKKRKKKLAEEDGVFSGSCNVENGSQEKKEKNKRNEDDELLKSSLQPEALNDVAEKPKKKKKRKKDLTSEPEEHLEEIKDCLENAEESGEGKRKKHRKKQKAASSDDGRVGGDDCIDESFSNEVVTVKKKKSSEEDEYVLHDAEPIQVLSEDTVAQSDGSVSVRKKKKKKRTGSFLVADAEETESVAADEPAGESAETSGSLEKADDGVRKKKKKRKKVEKDHEPDFEEPDRTCLTAVAEARVKGKKKCRRDDSESVTSVERDPDSQTEKEKKKKDEQEIQPATTEDNESEESTLNICVSLSHKKKSSAKGINETCNDSSAANDRATKETLAERASPSPEKPQNQDLNGMRGKKKKRKVKAPDSVLPEGTAFTETPEIEPHKPKNRDRTQPAESSFSSVLSDVSLSKWETSSSHSGRKNKHKKAKQRLYNPSEDLFTVC